MGNYISSTDVVCGAAALTAAVQFLTPADPIGTTTLLLIQFSKQVSESCKALRSLAISEEKPSVG